MNTIQLNGASHPLPGGSTLSDLVATLTGRPLEPTGFPSDGGRLGVAVALNSDIIPRSQWSTTGLHVNDEVEIVTAVQGG